MNLANDDLWTLGAVLNAVMWIATADDWKDEEKAEKELHRVIDRYYNDIQLVTHLVESEMNRRESEENP